MTNELIQTERATALLIGQQVEEIVRLKAENEELGDKLHQANSLISRMQAYILPLVDLIDASQMAFVAMEKDIAAYSRAVGGNNDTD